MKRIRTRLGVTFGTLWVFIALAPASANAVWAPGIEAKLPANASASPRVSVSAVSCASAHYCSAVGIYRDSSGSFQGLLLGETAGVWATGVEASLPANAARVSSLQAVSCASPGNCSAVGQYLDSSGVLHGLLLTETGGVWARGVEAALPANAGSPLANLVSVSCGSAGNCSAAGSYVDGAGNIRGLLLNETGGVWATGVEAAPPANGDSPPEVLVSSVSCASAGNCTAVGSYRDSSHNTQGLLLSETAGVWATGVEASLPANAGKTTQAATLTSVSCPSVGNCGAVGRYEDGSGSIRGLLLSETAGTWSTAAEAAPPANAATDPEVFLDSVSCPSAGNCSGVGVYRDNLGNEPGLLLTETSGAWSAGVVAALPANAALSTVTVASVSCATAGTCSAVGTYNDTPTTVQGLLLDETASAWATGIEASLPVNAATNPGVSLSSVSCPSAGNCTAVGGYTDSSTGQEGLLLDEFAPPDFSDLIADSRAVGPGRSLVDKARTAEGQIQAGAIADACVTLSGYIQEVKSQTGKTITRSQAPDLIGDARAIAAQVGCTGTVFATRRGSHHKARRHRSRPRLLHRLA
jgi:hypothetical protein